MVGEAGKCPECGADRPESNDDCPLCGPDIKRGREALDRSRKWRLTVLAIGAIIIVAAIALQPIVHEMQLTPSQKMIVTSNDLGPGWWSGEPEKVTGDRVPTADAAYVRLQYLEGSELVDGHCYLSKFQSQELAGAYFLEHRDDAVTNEANVSTEVTAVGDHAYMISSDMSGHDGWSKLIIVQKGSWVASIYLSTGSTTVSEELIVHAAEVQAAKLP
jgi:hypothetical protein